MYEKNCLSLQADHILKNKMTKAVFEPVPSNWERKPYFDYYFEKIKTKYNFSVIYG